MRKVFLDNNATTHIDKDFIKDFISAAEVYANPSSVYSQEGLDANAMLEEAREVVAKSINAEPEEIYFTSGATESNNWAIKGWLLNNNLHQGRLPQLFTSMIEHPSVYNTCKYMDEYNLLRFVGVDNQGFIDLAELDAMMKMDIPKNSLFSFALANNEIGTIQDLKTICEIVRSNCSNPVVHTDATQAYLHMDIDVKELGVDMLSASGHKFGCCSGVGFLYIRKGIEESMVNLLHGGKQERGYRAGTENFCYIIPMAKQVKRIQERNNGEHARVLQGSVYHTIKTLCEANGILCHLNGAPIGKKRLATNLSITLGGINAQQLIALLNDRGITISSGSACSSGTAEPSRVLKAIGLSDEDAFSTIRIGLNSHMDYGDLLFVYEELGDLFPFIK